MSPAEAIALAFHARYEALAPEFGYRTRKDSAKPWSKVPKKNRRLMIATVQALLDDGVIEIPAHETLLAPHIQPLLTEEARAAFERGRKAGLTRKQVIELLDAEAQRMQDRRNRLPMAAWGPNEGISISSRIGRR